MFKAHLYKHVEVIRKIMLQSYETFGIAEADILH